MRFSTLTGVSLMSGSVLASIPHIEIKASPMMPV